jgi:hypothetical protein
VWRMKQSDANCFVLSGRYLHLNGQVPAYEWNFSDVNPPVHAWAALFLYRMEKGARGAGDQEFFEVGLY